MQLEKLVISNCVILVCAFIGLSHGTDEVQDNSAELERKIISKINLIPNSKVYTHSVGDSRMITCVGNDIRWLREGKEIDSKDQKERIHVEDLSDPETTNPHLRLVFKTIEAIDNGEWTCAGTLEKMSFTMIVYVPIEFVPILESVITVDENENQFLSCKANGKPEPEIQWWFNGNRIDDTKGLQTSSKYIKYDNGLFIKNVTREDKGEYICKAYQISSSLSDKKEQMIQLDVLYEPEILYSERVFLNGKLDESSEIFVRYAPINTTLNLTCEADGNPIPDIIWYHQGKKFSHKHVWNEPYFSILTVHIHSNKSFGDYKCVAKNNMGKAEMPIRIKNGERPNKPEKFILGKSNDTLDIKVEFPNHVDSNQFPITHYRFEIMRKKDFDSNDGVWNKQKISNEKAKSNASYIITNLMPNTTYMVRVASINEVGLSEYTDVQEITTLVELPKKKELNGNVKNLPEYGLVIFTIFLNVLIVMN